MLDFLIYANAVLSVAAFLACVAYAIKHCNRFRWLFIWMSFLTGFVTVLYVLIATHTYSSADLIIAYRLIWTPQLVLYIAIVIALWEPKRR